MEAITFKNWTDTDFTWSFDGVPHTFPAGSEMLLESHKAHHFAKHLTDRELNKRNIPTNNQSERGRLGAFCFPTTASVSSEVDLDEKKEVEVVVTPSEEPEFEELEEKEEAPVVEEEAPVEETPVEEVVTEPETAPEVETEEEVKDDEPVF